MNDLVGSRWQILQHLRPCPPQQDRRELIVNAVQSAIAGEVAFFILHPVLVQEAKCRTEAASVDELHYGEQFFQLVFQWSSGQHERVPALQLLDSARSSRGPVPDALCF